MPASFRIPLLFVAFLFIGQKYASAQDLELGGHAKYQVNAIKNRNTSLQAAQGPDKAINHELDFRFTAEVYHSGFEFIGHAEVLGAGGSDLEARRSIASPFSTDSSDILPTDDRRLFDLSEELLDENNFTSVLHLDRLSLGYTGDKFVIRLGRQAISWGNGLVFQALDPFNPFSPIEIDKDYKAGDDMLYAQYLFDSGADLQLLLVPRRNPENSNIEEEQTTYALKYHGRIEEQNLDYDLVTARHFEEHYFGFGLSGEVLEAVWRLDAALIELENDHAELIAVANIDRSWIVFEKNLYGYIEYLHNGLGVENEDYTELSNALVSRLARGELFTAASNYTAIGFRLEATPLLNVHPSHILNLNDLSGFFQLRAVYDVVQDFSITTGINLPYGSLGEEFGGIELKDGSYLSPAKSAYVRLSYYF